MIALSVPDISSGTTTRRQILRMHTRARRLAAVLVALAVGTACASSRPNTSASTTPRTGRDVLERMHAMYAGKWFRTLTFTQTTTIRGANGQERVETWYEAAQSPTRLRIDVGDPAQGNGIIATPDSTYVMRAGRLAATQPRGNVFIPLIQGVYAQPVDESVRQLQANGLPVTTVREDTWQGRRVYVVGATAPTDTISPQFWVDAERLVAVRVLLPAGPNAQGAPLDVHLDEYVKLGDSWLATKVAMSRGGVLQQLEVYTSYRVDVPLTPGFFEAATWSTAPHWRK
jgi:hypothetical protein